MFGLFKKTAPYDGRVNRSERFKIQLELDKVRAEKHAETIATFVTLREPIIDGDVLKVYYELNIDYLGHVVEKLTAIETLLNDPGVIRRVETNELLHGKSLIQTILLKLNRIERKI